MLIRILPILIALPLVFWLLKDGGEEAITESVRPKTTDTNLKDKAAPALSFSAEYSQKSHALNLSALTGKPTMVHFWATWCGPCVEELPLLIDLAKDRKDAWNFITISLDQSWDEVAQFMDRYPHLKGLFDHTDSYLDAKGQQATSWGTRGLPETYLLDSELVVKEKLVGPQDWPSRGMKALLDRVSTPSR